MVKRVATRQPEEVEDYDDFRALEMALAIDENALNEALCAQPDLFYRVSKAYALQMSRRDAAKQALQDAEAAADLAERDAAQREDRKVTEGEIKARVQIDPQVAAARARLASLGEEVAKLSALKEAFQQRSYALKDLAGLYIANYYSASEHSGGNVAAYRDREAAQGRERMSEVRRTR